MSACGLSARLLPAEPPVLRRLVGDLHEIGDGQPAEDGGDEARLAGRHDKAGRQAGRDPQSEAVRAADELAERRARSLAARLLLHLVRPDLVDVAAKWGPCPGRDL